MLRVRDSSNLAPMEQYLMRCLQQTLNFRREKFVTVHLYVQLLLHLSDFLGLFGVHLGDFFCRFVLLVL